MKIKALLLIVAAGVLWGTSGIFVHYMTPYGFTSLQLTAVRGTVSVLAMAILALARKPSLLRANRIELLLFAGCGIGFFGTAACYYAAMQVIGVPTAVMLMYTAPVLVMLFSIAFLGERFSGFKMIALLCMLVGCAFVSGVIGNLGLSPIGLLLGVLSAFCYAAYNVFTKVALRRGADPLTTTLYTFLFMAVAAILSSRPIEIVSNLQNAPVAAVLWSLGLGIVTSVLPYFLYALALRELPAGTASALSVVEPMAATLFSVLLLGERLQLFSCIGIVLILFAVVLLSLTDRDRKQNKERSN